MIPSEFILNERTNLGSQGVAVIACAINKKTHDLLTPVHVEMHGIPGGDEPSFIDTVTGSVSNALNRSLGKQEELKAVRKSARSALLSILWERTNQRPLVVINILEI